MQTMSDHAPDFALAADLRAITCPACGYHVAVPFYDGGRQPLATLAWPASEVEARTMTPLPLDFVSCVDCGHAWNAAFDYRAVPYTDKPNLMFNRGVLWGGHLNAVRQAMLDRLPARPTVVEIGHGDASFLAALAAACGDGRYVGFDPNGAARADGTSLELRAALFDPRVHLAELKPDLIVSRHVLEHLTDPLGFVQQLSFGAAVGGMKPLLYLEVPCIDRAVESRRTVDFYYEHNSQFTTESFGRMLNRCGVTIERIDTGYDGEVIFGFARLGTQSHQLAHAHGARSFREATDRSRSAISRALDGLAASGTRVAIWGGTGKSAAFIHQHGVDAVRFPLVVDSDKDKAGTFVPGAGQPIQFRDVLLEQPVDVVIVPPQWRCRDIVAEMNRAGIRVKQVLIEHEGRLIDYLRDPHPYPRDVAPASTEGVAA
jgi:hypothetical protein